MTQTMGLLHHQEAARWFAKQRRGMMTLEEREAFATWRREPRNVSAMAELDEAWELLQSAQDRLGPKLEPSQASRPARLARPALLAAMCAVSLALGVISYSGNPDFWTNLDWVDR